jgi:hypothetical protein
MALGQYGAGFRIEEYEIETEGTYKGSPKRSTKIFKSYTVDPETGQTVREFDSPTYIKHEFTSAYDAGVKARQLHEDGTLFTVVQVADGRGGDNHESRLDSINLQVFLRGFLNDSRN